MSAAATLWERLRRRIARETTTVDRLLAVVRRVAALQGVPASAVTPMKTWQQLRFGTFSKVELAIAVEREFGVAVTASTIDAHINPLRLARLIDRKVAETLA